MTTIEEKKRAAGKSAIWYTLSSFLTKGLGFITIPIFTRIMTTGEFGLFNNFAAWQVILLAVLSLESYATLNRARLDYEGRALQEYQFTVLTCGIVLTAIVSLLLFVVPSIPESVTALDRQYLYMMALYLVFYPSFSMFQTLQRVQYRYKLSAGLSVAASLLATALSVALVVGLPDALMGRIVGQYVPFAVLGMVFYVWYWKTGGSFRLKYLRYALPLCIPLIIATLGSQVLLLGCRIVTQHSSGADQVAFLSLATTVANIALILITALNNAWAPWLYDCLEEKEYGRARKVFQAYAGGITALIVAVNLLGPELVLILGGESYLPTAQLVPAFMATCLFSMIARQYVFIETYHKDVRAGGIATLAFGVVNIPLCYLFIEFFGFESVGYANIVSNMALIVVHKVIVRRFDTPDIFSLKEIGIPTLVVLVAIPASLALYAAEAPFVRYGLVVAVFVCCIALVSRSGLLPKSLMRKKSR